MDVGANSCLESSAMVHTLHSGAASPVPKKVNALKKYLIIVLFSHGAS